jgi:hypothetical protein
VKLRGHVSSSGQPVEGAYVRLIGPSGDFTAEVRTNESGRFRFYPKAGAWEVRVSLPGGAHLEQPVTISDGQTLDMQINADNGAAVVTEVPAV